MGSIVETNDTLQITKEQGFPTELDLDKHLKDPLSTEDFKDSVFAFKDKPEIRIYHAPPVRNFFAENRDEKWIYWGLVHILEVTHDYVNQMTSGKFKIVKIFTPEEMKEANNFLSTNRDKNFFSEE